MVTLAVVPPRSLRSSNSLPMIILRRRIDPAEVTQLSYVLLSFSRRFPVKNDDILAQSLTRVPIALKWSSKEATTLPGKIKRKKVRFLWR